eukprot:g7080.t1
MKTCFLIFVVVFLIRVGCSHLRVPEEVSRRIRNQEQIVTRVANQVVQLFDQRHSYLRRCQCSTHSCSNDNSEFECSHSLGNVEPTCGADCQGRMINFNSSVFMTPPGSNALSLSPRLKESICLYSNLEPLMKELVPTANPSWLYFGGVDGSIRIYPAFLWEREVEDRNERLGQCRSYDPRIRPWFIGASTRPKDIVFVIDTSASMDSPVDENSKESRWNVTRHAVVSIFGTLSSFDYVNIVTFAKTAKRLDRRSSLRQGTEENLNYLVEKVKDEDTSEGTNFDAAFGEAFDILSSACGEDPVNKSCSECQKIILFLTDGRDTSQRKNRSIDASEMLEKIETYQSNLEQATSQRASIFTFSMGSTSDDSIPRQIACANNGSWSFIGPDTDPLTALNSYYHFLTSTGSVSSPIWINPYEDDGGLGLITTVAKPVYSRGTSDLDGIFLGVVGYDVHLRDLEMPGFPYKDVLLEIIDRSRTCDLTPQTHCQLQVQRNAHANRAVCADNISSSNRTSNNIDNTCYRNSLKFYKLITGRLDWTQAHQQCEADRGRLAVIESEDELAFVAGVASRDGSWIGARRSISNNTAFQWIDGQVANELLDPSSASWGIGEPNNDDGVEDCVYIDRRGISGNLNDIRCSTRRSFICEYVSNVSCATIVGVPQKGYFEIPPLSACLNEKEALANARPSPRTNDLRSEHVMCPLGDWRNSDERICCPDCNTKDRHLKRILLIAIPGCVILFAVFVFIWWRVKTKSKPSISI